MTQPLSECHETWEQFMLRVWFDSRFPIFFYFQALLGSLASRLDTLGISGLWTSLSVSWAPRHVRVALEFWRPEQLLPCSVFLFSLITDP